MFLELSGNIDGGLHEVGEFRFGSKVVRERDVLDGPQHFPRPAAERDRSPIEGVVENAGVDVDAAVVFGGFDVVMHVRGVRVF